MGSGGREEGEKLLKVESFVHTKLANSYVTASNVQCT